MKSTIHLQKQLFSLLTILLLIFGFNSCSKDDKTLLVEEESQTTEVKSTDFTTKDIKGEALQEMLAHVDEAMLRMQRGQKGEIRGDKLPFVYKGYDKSFSRVVTNTKTGDKTYSFVAITDDLSNNVIQNIVVAQKKNGKLDKPYFWQYKLNFVNSKVYLTQITIYKANGVKVNSNNINPCDEVMCDDYILPPGGDGSTGVYIGVGSGLNGTFYGGTGSTGWYGGGFVGGGFTYGGPSDSGGGGGGGGEGEPPCPGYVDEVVVDPAGNTQRVIVDCDGKQTVTLLKRGHKFSDDCCNGDDVTVGPVLGKGFEYVINNFLLNEPFGNAQPDPEHPAVKSMKAAVLQLRYKGYNSEFCDLFDDLLSDLRGMTMGDLHDVYKMILCAVGEYNSQALQKRDENLARAMMSIMSPENFATIFAFGNFFPTRTPVSRKIDVFIAKKAVSFAPDISKGYSSFNNFKKAFGEAPIGQNWHHIVEQNTVDNIGFAAQAIHHPDNLILISSLRNSQINAAYQTIGKYIPGMSLRNYLKSQPMYEHYKWGIKVLNEI